MRAPPSTLRRATTLALTAVALQLGLGFQSLAADTDTRSRIELVPVDVIAEQGPLGKPMTMARLPLPAGWQVQTSVRWNGHSACLPMIMQSSVTACAPDGRSAVEISPMASWTLAGTETPPSHCPVAPYQSVREYLGAMAAQMRPQARILDYEDLPQQAALAREAHEKDGGGPVAADQIKVETDAGRLLIAYRHDGMNMREVMQATLSLMHYRDGTVQVIAEPIASARAPAGRLELDLLDRIRAGANPNPQWQEAGLARAIELMQTELDARARKAKTRRDALRKKRHAPYVDR